MSHLAFIAGAYAIAVIGTVGLTGWSWIAMRRAEREADALKDRR
jgi:hypothetical protein